MIKIISTSLTSILSHIVASWPSVFGGVFLRRFIWGSWLQHCGCKVVFGDDVTIKGYSSILIKDNCTFMSKSYIYSHQDASVEIGDGFSCNHNVQINASGGGEIVIGDNVLIGPNVVLRASDHVFDDVNQPIRYQGHKGGVIRIDDDVWIAANVVITKDVHIGKGVIVGAGSVVTHDLPSMTVCAGIPAKPIRLRSEVD